MGVMKLAVVIIWFLLVLSINPETESVAFYAGLTVAVIGLLNFGGWLPLPGTTVNWRLYGIFQYANATGVFLAVCAFLTRLSNKRKTWAVVMETALILTQSVGGLGVYVIGWIIYKIINKKININFHLCGFILSAIMAAGMIALVRFTPLPWLAPLIPAAYVAARKPVRKILDRVSKIKFLTVGTVALVGAAGLGLLILRKFRPLATFAERIIQITDGFNAMLRHPLGIGPGAWAFSAREFQSADYNAVIPHCGYIDIGLSGGFVALICAVILIGYWLYRQGHAWNGYTVAAVMILIHAAQDISFSFLSIFMLLLLCVRSSLGERGYKAPPKSLGVIFAAAAVCCLLMFIPETVKNRAAWLANDKNYSEAIIKLEQGFTLPGDTRASLLRMNYALQSGNFDALDRAFGGIKAPNAEALYLKAVASAEQSDYAQAAEFAMSCIDKSPYWEEGYKLMEDTLPLLPEETQDEYRTRMNAAREVAKCHANILAGLVRVKGNDNISILLYSRNI